MDKQKTQLILLVLLFLIPPVAAFVLFYSGYRPDSGANFGELVQPARPVDSPAGLETIDGKPFEFNQSNKVWTLLVLSESDCDENCGQNMYKIQQVRLAQGKDMGRVRSVAILPRYTAPELLKQLNQDYPGVIIVPAGDVEYASLVEQFQNGDVVALQGGGRVYMIDPIGNVMMSYSPGAEASGMRKDLKRLLKVSQLGKNVSEQD